MIATITIEKGDTLSSIAKRYGTTVRDLAAQNGITNVNRIMAGATLNVGNPTPQVPAAQAAPRPANQPYAGAGLNTPLSNYTAPAAGDKNDLRNQVGSGWGAGAVQFGNGQYAQGDLAALKKYLNDTFNAGLTENNTADAALQAALKKYGPHADPNYLRRAVNPSGQNVWQYQADGLLGPNQNADPNPFAQMNSGNGVMTNGGRGGLPQVQNMLNTARGATPDIRGPKTDAANNDYRNLNQVQNLLNLPGSSSNIGEAYDAAMNNYRNAENAAFEAAKASLLNQNNKVEDQYNGIRSQAYVNARLQAAGNNEALAAQGLSGSLYDGAQSGVSESSRIAQDVSMRNDISNATRAEQSAKDEISQAIIQAGYTRDQNVARQLAEMVIQRSQAQMAADQQAFENQMAMQQFQFALQQYADSQKKRGGGPPKKDEVMEYAKFLLKSGVTSNPAYAYDMALKKVENKEPVTPIYSGGR